jgi:hypothetical protein
MVTYNIHGKYNIKSLILSLLIGLLIEFPLQAGWIKEKFLLDQKEEGFRYRDNLSFKFKLGADETIVDFEHVHSSLNAFEKRCTEEYLEKIEILNSKLPEKAAPLEWQHKNLAIFSVSLLFHMNDDIHQVNLSPCNLDNIPNNSSHIINPLTQRVFISGETLPFRDILPLAELKRIYNLGGFDLYSLAEATRYTAPNAYNERKKYIYEDLFKGFNLNKKYYNGLFDREIDGGDWQEYGISIVNKLQEINQNFRRSRISDQLEGTWGASLVDSEQSLRIYFQDNICEMLRECRRQIDPEVFLLPIVGIVLHVHSRMDMCEVCSASLCGLMQHCNYHWKQPNNTIREGQSYLLEQIKLALQGCKLDSNFRFRITVSSRETYVKSASVSRRNWAGIDQFSLTSPPDRQSLDFVNTNHCAHKPYFDKEEHKPIKLYSPVLREIQ